jgi:hypothetical protein
MSSSGLKIIDQARESCPATSSLILVRQESNGQFHIQRVAGVTCPALT